MTEELQKFDDLINTKFKLIENPTLIIWGKQDQVLKYLDQL